MFSFFSKMRLPAASNSPPHDRDEPPVDDTASNRNINLPWPVTEPGSSRRLGGASAAVGAGPSTTSLGLSNSGGGHGHGGVGTSQHPMTISNPILRATPTSLTGYDAHDTSSIRSGRRGAGGSISDARTPQDPAQWYEQEIQKPKGRRLYPPPSPQSPPHAYHTAGEAHGNEAERMAYAPPAVIRLDSEAFAAGADDEDDVDEDDDDQRFAYTVNPYSYGSQDHGSLQHSSTSLYSQRDSRNIPFLASHFPQPPQHTVFDPNIRGQSEADFYHSPFDEENDPDNRSDVDDGLAPMAVPVPARSATSTTSSRSMVSASSQPIGPGGSTASLGGGGGNSGTMSKGRWGLKLQLQQLQLQQHPQASQSTSSLPSSQALPNRPGPSGSPAQTSPQFSPPAEYPIGQAVSVDTDVYKHAYNYPLAKQLSPIAEQDYFSPSPHSSRGHAAERDPDSGSMSFRFGGSRKASPGVESVLKLKPSGGFVPSSLADADDRASIRSKSGSVRSTAGSIRAQGMSRVPSGGADGPPSAGIAKSPLGTPSGSDMPKPSPFITRPLNRTVSQTSSKSESIFQGTPTHSQPTTPRLEGYIPAHIQAMQNRTISQLATSSISPRNTIGSGSGSGSGSATIRGSTTTSEREILPTPPNSAGPTPLTATSASMYTPTTGFQTPISPTLRSPGNGSTPTVTIQPPPGAIVATTSPMQTAHGAPTDSGTGPAAATELPKIPSIPSMTPIDLRFSTLGSGQPQARGSKASMRRVDMMPVIEASVEGHYDEDEDVDPSEGDEEGEYGDEYDEEEEEFEYQRESLHADSFVTAGASHNGGRQSNVELAPMPGRDGVTSLKDKPSAASVPHSTGDSVRTVARTIGSPGGRGTPRSLGESFIHRRWERDEGYGDSGPLSSSPEATTFRAKMEPKWLLKMGSLTPAFWVFWLGFFFPVLWLVGGWHFTNAGEMPPKYTIWEWYFWNRRWRARSWFKATMRNWLDCWSRTKERKRDARKSVDSAVSFGDNLPHQRRQGRRRTLSVSKVRSGKVYPALPRWVAEKQSTDDGRMRLNDPKRSLRGIQFGYPFISRPPTSQASFGSGRMAGSKPLIIRILASPNRLLDQLYGVKLKEVRGRPESGRRMFDPWVQRCRYAFCYGLLLLAAGLCTASVYLIIINTKNVHT